jgi:N-dimethylarginine dimethylaminohydrolase
MKDNLNGTSPKRAYKQWEALYSIISDLAVVELLDPQPGLPDMLFTANAGLVLEDKFVLSRFLHTERQGEEQFFEDWFVTNQFALHKLPSRFSFEGAGDALLDRGKDALWAGYGHRSTLEAYNYISRWLNLQILPLRLVDDRFYHLDTCFCPLKDGYLLYYPAAFDKDSQELINLHVSKDKQVVANEADALNFSCNAINIENRVVLNRVSSSLRRDLSRAGFETIETELSEFMKSGGSAKCLTIRLDEPRVSSFIESVEELNVLQPQLHTYQPITPALVTA